MVEPVLLSPAAEREFLRVVLKCRLHKDAAQAKRLMAHLRQHGLESHTVLGNYLISMLVACGSLLDAQHVFSGMDPQHRNEHSWSSLITGYVDHGFAEHALHLYCMMQQELIFPSNYTFLALLRACAMLKRVDRAATIHAHIIIWGLEGDSFIANTLVDVYGKCGLLEEAHQVFEKLLVRDAVSWNTLIAGYAYHGLGEKSLSCFEQMQLKGVAPADITYVGVLKACTSLKDSRKGQGLHSEILAKGLDKDVIIGNTLIGMYGKCGLLAEAQQVFDVLPIQVQVSWNALIGGYAEHGFAQDALECVRKMQLKGMPLVATTFSCILKACGIMRALQTCQEMHTEITKRGFEIELLLGTAIVDSYANCGALPEAREVFNGLPVRDAVSWSALVSKYAEHDLDEEVLNCISQIQLERVSIDAVGFIHCLKACGNVGALETGRAIHSMIQKSGLEGDLSVGNMLLDMYGKCGSLVEGEVVFKRMQVRDVVTYTAMIKMYGENHKGSLAVQCFEDMQEQGMKPDAITFVSLLAACSHANLVVEGQEYFKSMKEEHGVEPTCDHLSTMVDLLGRSGHICDAQRLAEDGQCLCSKEVLGVLLTACKLYGEVQLGDRYFQQLILANRAAAAAAYMMMEEICASSGKCSDSHR